MLWEFKELNCLDYLVKTLILTSELRIICIFLAPFGSSIILVLPILFIFLSNSLLRTLHFVPSPPQTPHRSSFTGEFLIYLFENDLMVENDCQFTKHILIPSIFPSIYILPYRILSRCTFLEHKHQMDYHRNMGCHR